MTEHTVLNFNLPLDILGEIPKELAVLDCQDMLTRPLASQEQDDEWLKNLQLNLQHFKKFAFYPRVQVNGGVGIIVGASPAIKKNYKELIGAPHSFKIIATNPVARWLRDEGVRVDFTMVVEGRGHIKNDLDWDNQDIELVATPFVNHEALKKWRGPIWFYPCSGRDGTRYQEFFNSVVPEQCQDIGGGNVATTGMLWAYKYLGIRNFILTGMSFAYTDEYYFDGRKTAIAEGDRDNWKHIHALDIYGNIVKTTLPFCIYKSWLETYSQYMVKDNATIINATEDGILGVLPKPIEVDGTKVRFKPEYIPWINIVPLEIAIRAHTKRMEDLNNGTSYRLRQTVSTL